MFLVLAIYYAGEFFLNGKGPILLFKSMRCMIYIPCVYVRMTRVFFFFFFAVDVHGDCHGRGRAAGGTVSWSECILRVGGDLPVL